MDKMKYQHLVVALVALLIAQFSCLPMTPTSLPVGTRVNPSPIPSIGSVKKIQGAVQAGPESAMANVDPTRDMNNNDAINVFDSGKAELDFGYGLFFTLYN